MADNNIYDAIIVGGGPAGLTAAIYLARARYRVLVLEKDRFGGQITITHEVVNYPGIESTSGEALTETMRVQAANFGAEFMLAEVKGIEANDTIKTVSTSKGDFKAFALLIATGANPRHIGFEGESEFRGRGVAYCATCDGEFFTGKELLVIGGGYASAEEAMFLTRYASKVTILVRKDAFSCAKSIADEVMAHPKIEVKFNHELKSIEGTDMGIVKAHIYDNKNDTSFEYTASNQDTFGVFVFAGYVPNTSLVKDIVALDESGYIITDSDMQTNVKGVFAAGDVCIKGLRQVVTATADGALAACAMEKVAAAAHESTGIIPVVPNATRKAPQESVSAKASASATTDGSFVTEDMIPQLNAVFERMESAITLEVCSDGSDKGSELLSAMNEIAALSDKITVTQGSCDDMPAVRLVKNGQFTGLSFHGVPGGHEFTSFILGLYNASGPGQAVDDADMQRIKSIAAPTKIQVLISLSCTMCPDLVVAAQRIASLNDNVTTEVYDLNLFPALRDKYKVMSVPCLVVNEEHISFGRKNMSELLDIILK
ncbi:Thioredoxin reductase [Anaerobiospirillum thomasii]|uniref:FAD-dependent oxidoreductase n=1 Tax=Anaerobiospirillum thomasii TaxID=179995 RepID=UPI000DA0B29A|nr:FAD-dependent oxidoreductase [Anaerobiospirillum thomasii]SPT71915.1 Thioredoxin reductase [Anaerobiospirillum thomasii]